jgi:hypothetical protein
MRPEIKKTEPRGHSRTETYKSVFDLLKHLTTLSSGSALLLVTILERIIRGGASKTYIAFSFAGFCISILAAVTAMFYLSLGMDKRIADHDRNFFAGAVAVTIAGFFSGIVFLVRAVYLSL